MPQKVNWERRQSKFVKGSGIGLFLLLTAAAFFISKFGIKLQLAAESGLTASFSWSGQGDGTVEAMLKNVDFGASKPQKLKYHVYFCTKGESVGAIACSPLLEGDQKAKETLLKTNIDTKIPSPGMTQKISFPNLPKLAQKNCGRFQADLSIPNGPFITGKIFVIGRDCPEKEKPPKVSPSPSPSVKPTPSIKSEPSPSPRVSPSSSPSVSPSPTVSPSPGVNQQPECVSLSGSPTLGGAQLNVTFTGKGRDLDGIVREMHYNFGDGTEENRWVSGETNKDTLTILSHVYKNPGTYTASLRVKDNSGQGNEWSSTPESCKVTIKAEGEVLATTTTTTALPKAGANEALTLGYLVSGVAGVWLRRSSLRKGRLPKSGIIYQFRN